jgi:hypothetical protein
MNKQLATGTEVKALGKSAIVIRGNVPDDWTPSASDTVLVQFIPSRRGFPKADIIEQHVNLLATA